MAQPLSTDLYGPAIGNPLQSSEMELLTLMALVHRGGRATPKDIHRSLCAQVPLRKAQPIYRAINNLILKSLITRTKIVGRSPWTGRALTGKELHLTQAGYDLVAFYRGVVNHLCTPESIAQTQKSLERVPENDQDQALPAEMRSAILEKRRAVKQAAAQRAREGRSAQAADLRLRKELEEQAFRELKNG